MNPAELAADRAVIEAASPGPWHKTANSDRTISVVVVTRGIHGQRTWAESTVARCMNPENLPVAENAAFIAAARQRWPAALDEIERLQAELADVRVAREIDTRNRVQDRIEAGDKIERLRAKLRSRGINPDSDF